MPWTYGYDLHKLEQEIKRGKVSEPFVRCEATYSSRIPIAGACIDGFDVSAIEDAGYDQRHGQKYRIVAIGPADVKDMKTGDVDDALTIAVTFKRRTRNKPSTVKVELTDSKGKTTKMRKSGPISGPIRTR